MKKAIIKEKYATIKVLPSSVEKANQIKEITGISQFRIIEHLLDKELTKLSVKASANDFKNDVRNLKQILMKSINVRLFKGRISYAQYPYLKLHDFFIYPFFYFSFAYKYGWWTRIKILGKWYKLSKIKNNKQ